MIVTRKDVKNKTLKNKHTLTHTHSHTHSLVDPDHQQGPWDDGEKHTHYDENGLRKWR